MAAGSFKIYGLQKDGSRIPAAGSIGEGGSSGGASEIITLTQAEFDVLSQTDIANYHANGVRTILVNSMTDILRSYGIDAAGNAVPIGAGDALKLGGIEAENYALKAPNNYAYDGVDLSTVFASAAELHAAVAAGDFSKIRVGDYWPITLSGSYTDYGDNTTKTLNNAIVKLEVAGINQYINHGDTALTVPHLLMCSRDLLPNTTKWRTADTTWTDTSATNPWKGSAIYKTLNTGILPLVQATDVGAYIFAGPNGNGMRFLSETKAASATTATAWKWLDRGKLFLPLEREVWGQGVWSELTYGANPAIQWPIFAGSFRHVGKGLGDGGSRYGWWLSSSYAGNASSVCYVTSNGYASTTATSGVYGLALCFLLA